MTRDHYKGSKKSRDAIVRADGTVVPLDKLYTGEAFTRFSSLITDQLDWTGVDSIYARATGSDSGGEGTLSNPYRTLVRCLEDVPNITTGASVFIDISGIGTETVEGPLDLPPVSGYRTRAIISDGKNLRDDYRWVRPFSIFAEPTVIQTFTADSSASDATTTRKSYTLNGAGWAADEHKGKFLIGTGQGQSAVIVGNSEDTIVSCTEKALTGPLSIVEPSATIKSGYTSNPPGVIFAQPFNTGPVSVPFSIVGVAFEHNNGSSSAVRAYSGDDNYFELCSFAGMSGGGRYGNIAFVGCYFGDAQFDNEQGELNFESCFFDETNITSFNGGEATYFGCTFVGVTPIGSDPVYNRDRDHPKLYIEHSTIVSGTGDGIVAYNLSRSFVGNTTINDCVGDAIYIDRGSYFVVRTVTGAGNGGYGVKVENGAQAEIRTGAVTGALGDFKVGTLLAPSDWAGFVSAGANMLDVNTVSGTLSRMFGV